MNYGDRPVVGTTSSCNPIATMAFMERLNKLLAHAGVGSRRKCDALIRAGRVAIDGRPVQDLGTKVEPAAHKVTVDGRPVGLERPVYWLVNKPRGVVCTNHDPAGRTRAIDLVPHVEQRVYTVGRLDEMSEGLLLLTNDGDLAHQLMHPRFGVEKTYLVQVQGDPSKYDLAQLLRGVWLSEGKVQARRIKRLKRQGESTWLRIILAEGKNREIRRMLAKQGHKVLTLKREAIGPVQLDRLPKGKARRLSGTELEALRQSIRRRARTDGDETNLTSPPERTRRS
jgi:23S rRNA pseudouridine2605 synthase